ncbi:MAG: hypothetical protein WBE72_02310 [Terracidiphilus sp.]
MTIDTVTASLLQSTLGSPAALRLFTTIAKRRIADVTGLKKADPEADQELDALQVADLIGANSSREKFYITAKGLKVARDLEKLPVR